MFPHSKEKQKVYAKKAPVVEDNAEGEQDENQQENVPSRVNYEEEEEKRPDSPKITQEIVLRNPQESRHHVRQQPVAQNVVAVTEQQRYDALATEILGYAHRRDSNIPYNIILEFLRLRERPVTMILKKRDKRIIQTLRGYRYNFERAFPRPDQINSNEFEMHCFIIWIKMWPDMINSEKWKLRNILGLGRSSFGDDENEDEFVNVNSSLLQERARGQVTDEPFYPVPAEESHEELQRMLEDVLIQLDKPKDKTAVKMSGCLGFRRRSSSAASKTKTPVFVIRPKLIGDTWVNEQVQVAGPIADRANIWLNSSYSSGNSESTNPIHVDRALRGTSLVSGMRNLDPQGFHQSTALHSSLEILQTAQSQVPKDNAVSSGSGLVATVENTAGMFDTEPHAHESGSAEETGISTNEMLYLAQVQTRYLCDPQEVESQLREINVEIATLDSILQYLRLPNSWYLPPVAIRSRELELISKTRFAKRFSIALEQAKLQDSGQIDGIKD